MSSNLLVAKYQNSSYYCNVMQHILFEWNLITDKDLVHQFTRVLRYKVWDEFIAIDWKWWKKLYAIEYFDRKQITIKLLKDYGFKRQTRKIMLYICLPNAKQKWEYILQKGAELWVTDFIPIASDFTQWKYPHNTLRDIKILTEAIEQSERLFLPTIHNQMKLSELFVSNKWVYYVFHSRWKLLLQKDLEFNLSQLNIVIWPEWWFSSQEIKTMQQNKNIVFVSLWKSVLRLETAVICALSRFYI